MPVLWLYTKHDSRPAELLWFSISAHGTSAIVSSLKLPPVDLCNAQQCFQNLEYKLHRRIHDLKKNSPTHSYIRQQRRWKPGILCFKMQHLVKSTTIEMQTLSCRLRKKDRLSNIEAAHRTADSVINPVLACPLGANTPAPAMSMASWSSLEAAGDWWVTWCATNV